MGSLFHRPHMTASFMRYFKKIKQLFFAGLAALFVLGNVAAHAASGLNIKSAELTPVDDAYVLNADVDIKFSPELEQAINKGFELSFLVEFQLVTPHKYWFDDEIVTITQQVTLSYHALSRQYLLMRGDQQKIFSSLDDLKQALSEIRDVKVVQKNELDKGEAYKAFLLMRLDHKKLPRALLVDAMGSDDWRISSQRFEWVPNFLKAESSK